MDIKEAIEELENGEFWDKCVVPCVADNRSAVRFHAALAMAIAALRDQQEGVKLDRSRWEGCGWCRQFGGIPLRGFAPRGCTSITVKYCPSCGRPLTEEEDLK